MSISSALNSAVSGLTASARAAEVVSSNLANVLTEGYGTRRLEVDSLEQGRPGVRITSIIRHVDQGLLADRRVADSERAHAETRAQFLSAVERVIGTPEDPASLSARLARFEASMVSASTHPENNAMLQNVVLQAQDLVRGFNSASDEVQRQRTDADGEINRAVETVNTLLGNIRKLNVEIANHSPSDHYAASLQDHRQILIDQLSGYVPVRQVPRDNGTVALFTPGGAILLDGTAAELEFSASNVVAPHMTLGNGLISGLSVNGIPVQPSGTGSPVEGGRLAALFSLRDDLAVGAQTQLDAVARDVLERFQQAGIDPTLGAGDPGLFTDGGALFDPLNEIGVAGRLSLNALVDPDQGGMLWHLRDGLGATGPGPEGNGTILVQLSRALGADRSLASGDLGATPRAASGHLANLTSRLAQDRLSLDQALSFAIARQNELVGLELQQGVDTDSEMQRLLLIEQAYAANARMIETIDDMMQTLLRI